MKELKISIVTCVFNGQETIKDTILSVINQDYENYEMLIIDGVSNDNTVEIVEKFSNQDSRIKLISEVDKGIYDAYNKGVRKSSGEVIIFVNADDFLFKNALRRINMEFNTNEYDVYAGSISILNEKDNYYKKHLRSIVGKHSITNPSILTPGLCFKRDLFKKVGLFNISYKICADFDFISRCINQEINIMYSDSLINNMREGGVSSNLRFEKLKKLEQLKVNYKNSSFINFKYIFTIILKYFKVIILNSIFSQKLKAKKNSFQDEFIERKIFWFR